MLQKKLFMAGSRGQAAMEYLVTYGWALLALILVIALLYASGAFSSSAFLQPECTFQPDLPCSPYIIYTTTLSSGAKATMLHYTLTNNLGFPIKIVEVNYTVRD
ncbi:MAG: hypothetical protein N3G22_04705, partial [Candidatus Micrarchaeota archaeon]|nr:hypothetical protein [Candidatus Micrarchaeota archaeon]